MINEITCTSNNSIELSRGQLLNWLNNLLKCNISKIQQLGTGAVYCQLLDIVYPGKVPLSKVNWKAKLDYEYLNNFKVLQQSFTKLNIMKHIDVQKLVKCKYQDNLQFLQWFKKIFDTTASNSKDYDPVQRRGEKLEKEKENKTPHTTSTTQSFQNNSVHKQTEQTTERTERSQRVERIEKKQKKEKKLFSDINSANDEKLISLMKYEEKSEKEFYLKKMREIEHLMQKWDCSKASNELIENIRKIILVPDQVDWSVSSGQFISN